MSQWDESETIYSYAKRIREMNAEVSAKLIDVSAIAIDKPARVINRKGGDRTRQYDVNLAIAHAKNFSQKKFHSNSVGFEYHTVQGNGYVTSKPNPDIRVIGRVLCWTK